MTSDNIQKNNSPKGENLKTWLEAKPYWERRLWELHLEKEVLNESDIDECYSHLLADSGIVITPSGRPAIAFPLLDFDEQEMQSPKTVLNKIENLRNVNAVDENCIVEFSEGITIIYGDNGSGKSGIGRLLSNACHSRMPRQILPNAHTTIQNPTVTADFHISDSAGSRIINYIQGQPEDALKGFSVFDHECAPIHLNEENKVDFVPSKLRIFEDVFRSLEIIEAKLRDEISKKQETNPSQGVFTQPTPLKTFLDSLSYRTTDKELEDFIVFTEADEQTLTGKKNDLSAKMRQDTARQKKELSDECSDLNSFKNMLFMRSGILNEARATAINSLLEDARRKKVIAESLSVKDFDFDEFKNIGTPEWKSLIVAAQKLHAKEASSAGKRHLDHCMLCRQGLGTTEKTLFEEYWKFLESTAEADLLNSRQNIAKALRELEKEAANWPAFSESETAIKILKKEAPEEEMFIGCCGYVCNELMISLFIKTSNHMKTWLITG